MYTVRKLAALAGVTPRSLHYYDEIGLLPPARIAENGYRCYDEGSLLRLQQILLYRELDLPLAEIKRILDGEAFDALISLRGHQETLRQRIKRTEKLIASIADTIQYLEGKKEMDEIKMFEPFNEKQQAEYEVEVAEKYDPGSLKHPSKNGKAIPRRINSASARKAMLFTGILCWPSPRVPPHPKPRIACGAGGHTWRIFGNRMMSSAWAWQICITTIRASRPISIRSIPAWQNSCERP